MGNLAMKVEAVHRPLSIDCFRDGGVYALRAGSLVQTNVFLKVACVDDVFVKVPSKRGFEDYRNFVKLAQPTCADIRPFEEAERFENLESTLERFLGFEQLVTANPEIAHYLAVHKVQYERLQTERNVCIPTARFGVLRLSRLLRRFEPVLFQERIRGTTLWEMYDFSALEVLPRWRPFLPAIAAQLSKLLDPRLLNHIDWNIQNFRLS